MKTLIFAAALLAAATPGLRAADEDLAAQIQALRADVEMMKSTHAQDRKAAGLNLWVQATGYYSNVVGAGDDAAAVSKNRGSASSIVDFGFDGKPAEGLEASAVLRLDAAGLPAAWDIWAQQELPLGLSLRGGFLDLTGLFDASAIANDEKTQFITPEFVDSPALGNGANAPALRLHWQASEAAYVQAAVQDFGATATDPFDDLYTLVEAGHKHELFGASEAKVWYRESGRAKQGAVTAYGVVIDQALGEGLQAFARWGQEFKATGLEHDPSDPSLGHLGAPLNGGGASGSEAFVSASLGLEWTGPLSQRPQDRLAAAWGTVRACDTSSRDYAEANYAWVLNANALASLHYQTEFSRQLLPVANDWDGDSLPDSTTYAALPDLHRLVARVNLAY